MIRGAWLALLLAACGASRELALDCAAERPACVHGYVLDEEGCILRCRDRSEVKAPDPICPPGPVPICPFGYVRDDACGRTCLPEPPLCRPPTMFCDFGYETDDHMCLGGCEPRQGDEPPCMRPPEPPRCERALFLLDRRGCIVGCKELAMCGPHHREVCSLPEAERPGWCDDRGCPFGLGLDDRGCPTDCRPAPPAPTGACERDAAAELRSCPNGWRLDKSGCAVGCR